jgi:hypothetical protein
LDAAALEKSALRPGLRAGPQEVEVEKNRQRLAAPAELAAALLALLG